MVGWYAAYLRGCRVGSPCLWPIRRGIDDLPVALIKARRRPEEALEGNAVSVGSDRVGRWFVMAGGIDCSVHRI